MFPEQTGPVQDAQPTTEEATQEQQAAEQAEPEIQYSAVTSSPVYQQQQTERGKKEN